MYYLMTLNSAVNPFIYIAFNRELRRPLLRLFPFLTRYIIVVGYDKPKVRVKKIDLACGMTLNSTQYGSKKLKVKNNAVQ